ncbi:MAG: hypothetical protein MZV64_09925 [Ignavibacteriales bacterium]|nr:hypothetical protein [Ignavibacteriales bacterium]
MRIVEGILAAVPVGAEDQLRRRRRGAAISALGGVESRKTSCTLLRPLVAVVVDGLHHDRVPTVRRRLALLGEAVPYQLLRHGDALLDIGDPVPRTPPAPRFRAGFPCCR